MRLTRFATHILAASAIVSGIATTGPVMAGAGTEPPLGGTSLSAQGQLVASATSWEVECVARANGMSQQESAEASFEVTAPAAVATGQVFQVRVAPRETSFVDHVTGILFYAPVDLLDVTYTYALPMGAVVEAVSVVPGTGAGWAGDPVVAVDHEAYRPGRISLTVPEVPSDGDQLTDTTPYRLPAVDVTLRATGPKGSTISTRVAGVDEATAGQHHLAQSPYGTAETRCWRAGGGLAPALSETVVSSGPASVPTTIDLIVEPATVEVDDEVRLSALVSAPLGVVELRAEGAVVGQVSVDQDGSAELVVPPAGLGEVEYSAHYLGAEGYEASSAAATVLVVPEAPYFSDVPGDHPFFQDIQWASEAGLTNVEHGQPFQPGAPVARQVAAAFLYRFAGQPYGPSPACVASPFGDVPVDHPFCAEITWMVTARLTTGYGQGLNFQPGNPITRQAAAAFLYRHLVGPEPPPPCTTAPFSDVPVDHPFCAEITWMVGSGLTAGFGDGSFRPGAGVTRQAMVAFLHRAWQPSP